jgi:hypothetical protein
MGPLGTAATPGLFYLPRVIVRMEKLAEWTVLAGETEVLGENLSRLHFVHHKWNLLDPAANPSLRSVKSATNRFSYGAAVARRYTDWAIPTPINDQTAFNQGAGWPEIFWIVTGVKAVGKILTELSECTNMHCFKSSLRFLYFKNIFATKYKYFIQNSECTSCNY